MARSKYSISDWEAVRKGLKEGKTVRRMPSIRNTGGISGASISGGI